MKYMRKVRLVSLAAAMFAAVAASAEVVVDASGVGKALIPVSVSVADADFAKSLKKNLELSGLFTVAANGAVRVSGASGAVTAQGAGKIVRLADAFGDAKAARMAARKLANSMCEAYGGQRGFALDRIVFLSRGRSGSEICTAYPDGYDIRSVTSDGKAAVGIRWKDAQSVFYTGFLNAGPQVFELNTDTGARRLKWSFKGLTTGAAVSPDGGRVAIILSFQGNPELYVIDLATSQWTRMTKTPGASEGQPAWSPDGRRIVYVSDETRHPQLYVVDVATKERRRLTSRGAQSVDPDWGPDGRIAYVSKQGGQSRLAVLDPAQGESGAKYVTAAGSWEHPSWARDARHLVAGRDKALFVVDTELRRDGTPETPRQVFQANGNWCDPSWSR